MECGFYVATWLERQILQIAGKSCLEVTAEVDVDHLKGCLLKMLYCWSSTMKRLQKEVPKPAADPPPGGDDADDLMEELERAAAGFRAGDEPVGDAARPRPLEA